MTTEIAAIFLASMAFITSYALAIVAKHWDIVALSLGMFWLAFVGLIRLANKLKEKINKTKE